jgi:hypothetical protein
VDEEEEGMLVLDVLVLLAAVKEDEAALGEVAGMRVGVVTDDAEAEKKDDDDDDDGVVGDKGGVVVEEAVVGGGCGRSQVVSLVVGFQ